MCVSEINIERNNNIFKIAYVGDEYVGKSSLIKKICDDKYDDSYDASIGVDIRYSKYIHNDNNIKIKIYDIAGHSKYLNITQAYLQKTDICIIVFDMTSDESFYNITKWYEICQTFADNNNIEYILVGTKCDLFTGTNDVINFTSIDTICKQLKFPFISTSAKANHNINTLQQAIFHKINKLFELQNIKQTKQKKCIIL
jgi:small GTP-binding protein